MRAGIARYMYIVLYYIFHAFAACDPIPETAVVEDGEREGKEEMFEITGPGQPSKGMDSTPHNTHSVHVLMQAQVYVLTSHGGQHSTRVSSVASTKHTL